MKTDNQLIAEFEGYIVSPDGWINLNEYGDQINVSSMDYHSNWNSLMRVLDKISMTDRTLVNIYDDGATIAVDDEDGYEIYGHTTHGNKDNRIGHVYRAVMFYIDWYNSQK